MLLLLRYWREALIVLLLGSTVLLYKTRTPAGQSSVTEKDHEVQHETVSDKSVTTTVEVKKPDGTVETTTTTNTNITKDLKSIADKSVVTTVAALSKYRLGIMYTIDYDHLDTLKFDKENFTAEAGARLGDLPLFIMTGVNIWKKEISIGIQVDL